MERVPYRNNYPADTSSDEVIKLAITPGRTVSKRVTLSTLSEEGRHLSRIPNLRQRIEMPKILPESLDPSTVEDLNKFVAIIEEQDRDLANWQKSLEEPVSAEMCNEVEKIREDIQSLKNTIGDQVVAVVEIEGYEANEQTDPAIITELDEQIYQRAQEIDKLFGEVCLGYADFIKTMYKSPQEQTDASEEVMVKDLDGKQKPVWGEQTGPSFEAENLSNEEAEKQLNQLEKQAAKLVSAGRRQVKGDFSEHMPGQNDLLARSLFFAQDEINKQIKILREKLNKNEAVTYYDVAMIQADMERMKTVVDMLPARNQLHEKEDFERPSELTSDQRDELQRLFVAVEKTPLSIEGVVNHEKSADIQQDYEKLQELIEEFQEEVARILNVGVVYSRDWRALDEIQEDITRAKEKIERTLAEQEQETSQEQDDTFGVKEVDREWLDYLVNKKDNVPKIKTVTIEDAEAAEKGQHGRPSTKARVAATYPGKISYSKASLGDTKQSGTEQAVSSVESPESPDQELLRDYETRIDFFGEKIAYIKDRVIDEQLSNDDKTNFGSMDKVFLELKEAFDNAKTSALEDKEIDPETKKSLLAYTKWLETAVDHYQEKLEKNTPPFFKEESTNLDDTRESPVEVKVELAGSQSAPENLKSSTFLSRQPKFDDFEEGKSPNYTIPPEYLAYGETREKWLEAKKVHDEKRAEYLSAVDKYYADWAKEVEGRGFIDRNWTKFRTKFGVKPELSEEITALLSEADAASETYGQYAREMTEKRGLAGKKTRSEISLEVLNRYNRRFGHEIAFNTLKRQTELQAKAVESLGFKPGPITSKLIKYKTPLKLLGAGALGFATGGLAGLAVGGAWWARSTAGGAAAAGVAGLANKKWSESIKNWTKEQQEAEVQSLALKINDKALSKEEIAEYRGKLKSILDQADEKTRTKMFAIIGAAAATGALVGGGVGAVGEGLFGTDVSATGSSVPESSPPGALNGETVLDNPTKSVDGSDAAAKAAGAPAKDATYTAGRGDNFWDIMEGQTEVGKLDYLNKVDEAHRQEVIDLVRDKINTDASLREELGFGETADYLAVGEEVDTEKLNQLAEEIVKENGWGEGEGTPEAEASEASAPESPEVSAEKEITATNDTPTEKGPAVTETASDSTAAPTEKPGKATETLFMKSVTSDKNIEFARSYQGGYVKFEADFQKLFVEKIQGPAPADSLFGRIFGGPPNSADAFKIFGPYSIAEFNELEKADAVKLAKALADEQIDMKDYLAWKDALKEWKEAGLVINPKDRFSDVAEAAFINSLNQPKTS